MRDVIVGTLSKKINLCESFIRSLVITHPYFKKEQIIVIDDTRLLREELEELKWLENIILIPSIRPWGFSLNANLLIQAALIKQQDLLLCNDDTEFMTPNGIYAMQQISNYYPNLGIISPVFCGAVGNEHQVAFKGQYENGQVLFIEKERPICFVAVYLPYDTLNKVGFMNEAFDDTSYGWEDNDYCDRVREAGFDLGITPMVKMRHGSKDCPFSSTYRDVVNFNLLVERGKKIYEQETQRRKSLFAGSF